MVKGRLWLAPLVWPLLVVEVAVTTMVETPMGVEVIMLLPPQPESPTAIAPVSSTSRQSGISRTGCFAPLRLRLKATTTPARPPGQPMSIAGNSGLEGVCGDAGRKAGIASSRAVATLVWMVRMTEPDWPLLPRVTVLFVAPPWLKVQVT